MKKILYKLQSKVVLYPGMGGWHFVGINKEVSTEIKAKYKIKQKGFGSIPIEVTVGKTIWNTSIFPDTKSGMFLLPIKARVRKIENIEAGDNLNFSICIR